MPIVPSVQSPLLQSPHAFFMRHGGVSVSPYDSLNFGGSEDDPNSIAENRRRGLALIGADLSRAAWMKQVHGNEVKEAVAGGQECDGLVTAKRGLALAVSTADCYPLLFEDLTAGVVAVAHAGWRGTVARIAAQVIDAMQKHGASPENIHVAIGPGICGKNYEVGEEVLQKFRDEKFPESCFIGNLLDLTVANHFVLSEKNIPAKNIWISGRCSTEQDFFSYRRDAGKTGRMWSVIVLR